MWLFDVLYPSALDAQHRISSLTLHMLAWPHKQRASQHNSLDYSQYPLSEIQFRVYLLFLFYFLFLDAHYHWYEDVRAGSWGVVYCSARLYLE